MGVAPTTSFFLESVNTGSQAHTSQWLAEDISRVIDSVPPPTVVSGAVTDNTAANKLAWTILEKKYSNKFFHGCVCHCLHLLVKDIFGDEGKRYLIENKSILSIIFNSHYYIDLIALAVHLQKLPHLQWNAKT